MRPLHAILVLAVAAVAFNNAAVGQKGDVADVSVGTGGVVWHPLDSCLGLGLTVAVPSGEVLQETFPAGEAPSLDLSGGYFPDGRYSWELRVVAGYVAINRNEDDAGDEAGAAAPALVQSGSFTVNQGAIAVPGAAEETALKDISHADDVIIDGNLNVGGYSVAGRDFGSDTIILSYTVPHILFEDTSSGTSYPTNDWRLAANDNEADGDEYFAIEDVDGATVPFRIDAGAPDNALRIDSTGRIGIGTSVPAAGLHVVTGEVPVLRLDQDASLGSPPYSWAVGGGMGGFYIEDVAGGNLLPFSIRSGAPTGALDIKTNGNVMMCASGGNVGIGGVPSWPLTVETTGRAATLVLNRTDGAFGYINAGHTYVNIGTGTSHHLRFMVNGSWETQINTDGSLHMASGASCSIGGVWTNSSSRELKDDIESLSAGEAMEALAGLEPVTYSYKADKSEQHVGFIAEDVPDLVATKDRKGMSPMDVTAVLTKVVQEQQRIIKEQQAAFQRQQRVNARLQARLDALERNDTK
jgi:Chaperone of endosialidase